MTRHPALGTTRRVATLVTDKGSAPYFRVPLDDKGENYALVDWEDYEHIIRTLGCYAAWYLGGTRGRRKYVRVNVPHVGGSEGGHFTVVRLFSGITPQVRVRYVTPNTLDLRRSNLIVEAIQDGRNLDGGAQMAQAVQRRRAVKKKHRRLG